MKRHLTIIMLLVCMAGMFADPAAGGTSGIIDTKHNLSKSGPGLIKATSEDRICVFCHTPHNAAPQTPLWNKTLEGVNYTPYSSSTMLASPSQPTGPSRLCLSCHDGTLALGAVMNSGTWDLTGQSMPIDVGGPLVEGKIPDTRPSYLGFNLEGDHPFSFSYYMSIPNVELSPVPPADLLFYGSGVIHCTTCHDPHDNTNNKFLAVNNENSGLCTLCHTKTGWATSSHSTYESTWDGTPPNPWPRTWTGTDFGWTTVKQNGCENCHAPHNAVGHARLLNCFTETGPCSPATEEGVCYPCHNGHMIPPVKNIFAQFGAGKISKHDMTLATGIHDPRESPRLISNHVECADCHNSHTVNDRTATAPSVSGRLYGVTGVSINDTSVRPADNEYEICFKCHASSTAQSIFYPIPRVIDSVNTRIEFQDNNPSRHPVAGMGASSDVPSLLLPLTTSSMIYCTDCHSDESVENGGSGSRGPHGSQYAPILREQYKTTNDNIAYNSSNFTLCYRCHNESDILNDTSFKRNTVSNLGGHSGHIRFPAYSNCSACHDPHGMPDNGLSGSHKRLINFDTRIVSALPGFSYPIFAGSGNRSGNCALVCHDSNGDPVPHDGSTKYSYGGYGEIGVGNIHMGW